MANSVKEESVIETALTRIGDIVEKIVILRVTTVVGTVTATDIESDAVETKVSVDPSNQLVAHSVINTALGDMNTVFSKGFVEDAALLAMHKQALLDAHAIRKESVDMLVSAIKAIRDGFAD